MAVSYVAWEEFDDHAQDEPSPEDVQSLQDEHQPVEEVEAEEGGVEGQGVHTRCVYDPVWEGQRQNRESSQRHQRNHQKPIDRRHDNTMRLLLYYHQNVAQNNLKLDISTKISK